MNDFLSRLADKSVGLSAVIQPRPLSLFELAPTAVHPLPVSDMLILETQRFQTLNIPQSLRSDEEATEMAHKLLAALPMPETTIQPQSPYGDKKVTEVTRPRQAQRSMRETTSQPTVTMTAGIIPRPAAAQPPLPDKNENDSAPLSSAPEPTSQSPIQNNNPLPLTSVNATQTPLAIARQTDAHVELTESASLTNKGILSAGVTAVSPTIIQALPAEPLQFSSNPTAQSKTNLSEPAIAPPIMPLAAPLIPLSVATHLAPPMPTKEFATAPKDSTITSLITIPVAPSIPPLVEKASKTSLPLQSQHQHSQPNLLDSIIPRTTKIETPQAITAVVQPSITLYQEPKRQTAVPANLAPTIEVRIGRIEVRAAPPPAPPVKKQSAAPPVMSLDDYLRQRQNGGTS